MQIQLRAIWREDSELLVGTPLWFAPADKVDAISVTANVSTDFTTLTNIARKYRWDHKYDDLINEASQKSNKINQVGILNCLEPTILLVPKTRGDHTDPLLITDLLLACDHLKVKTLHFSHYAFLIKRFPVEEIKKCLEVMLNPLFKTSIERVIFDIDKHFHKRMSNLLKKYQKYYKDLYPNEIKSNVEVTKDLEVKMFGMLEQESNDEENNRTYVHRTEDRKEEYEYQVSRLENEKLYLLNKLKGWECELEKECERATDYEKFIENYNKLKEYFRQISETKPNVSYYLDIIKKVNHDLNKITDEIEYLKSEIKESS